MKEAMQKAKAKAIEAKGAAPAYAKEIERAAMNPRLCRDDFDPMTCSLPDIRCEIDRVAVAAALGDGCAKARVAFLAGIEHARIIIAAATGGRVS